MPHHGICSLFSNSSQHSFPSFKWIHLLTVTIFVHYADKFPCRMGLTTLVRNHWQKYKQPFIFCIIGSSMETRSVANSAFSSRLEPLLWTALKWWFISVNTVHWHTQSELIYGKLKLSFSHKLENSLPHNLILHIFSQWTYPSSWRISVSIRSNSLS